MKNKNIILILIVVLIIGFLIFYFSNQKVTDERDRAEPQSAELPHQENLPGLVEAKRQAIYKAALSGDYDKLAEEAGPSFGYTYGEEYPGGFAAFAKNEERGGGRSALYLIPTLLKMPYAMQGDIYVWPGVFAKTSGEWTPDDVNLMKQILTDREIEGYKKFGAYAYYRIGINKTGEWVYYVAGD